MNTDVSQSSKYENVLLFMFILLYFLLYIYIFNNRLKQWFTHYYGKAVVL